MRPMGSEAHYPKLHLSSLAPGHQVYPYMPRGAAIELSNTLETNVCLVAMEAAFRFGQVESWNSDQGSQFTPEDLLAHSNNFVSRSVWMGAGARSTTCSSNGCGAH